MEFSKRGEYALRALINLEIASELGRSNTITPPRFRSLVGRLKKVLASLLI